MAVGSHGPRKHEMHWVPSWHLLFQRGRACQAGASQSGRTTHLGRSDRKGLQKDGKFKEINVRAPTEQNPPDLGGEKPAAAPTLREHLS